MNCVMLVAALLVGAVVATPGPTVVTGATGHTGSIVYNLMRKRGHSVRALVRNVTKAKDLLGCSKCDESEGIFVGDITDASSMTKAMAGAASLMIVTAATPIVKVVNGTYHISFPKGGEPIDIDWHGAQNQLRTFAERTGALLPGMVVLMSTLGTERPDQKTDKYFKDYQAFYKLNFEAYLMSSGLQFTIIKAGGLDYGGTTPGVKELVVGHDASTRPTPSTIARADVARVMVAAVENSKASANLRFELCSRDGPATSDDDLVKVLADARYPWDHAAATIV